MRRHSETTFVVRRISDTDRILLDRYKGQHFTKTDSKAIVSLLRRSIDTEARLNKALEELEQLREHVAPLLAAVQAQQQAAADIASHSKALGRFDVQTFASKGRKPL